MHQVGIRETNTGEPPFQRREVLNDVKTGESSVLRDKPCGNLITEQGGVNRTRDLFGRKVDGHLLV